MLAAITFPCTRASWPVRNPLPLWHRRRYSQMPFRDGGTHPPSVYHIPTASRAKRRLALQPCLVGSDYRQKGSIMPSCRQRDLDASSKHRRLPLPISSIRLLSCRQRLAESHRGATLDFTTLRRPAPRPRRVVQRPQRAGGVGGSHVILHFGRARWSVFTSCALTLVAASHNS